MIAQHMIARRVCWFQVWTDGEGSPDLAPIAQRDPADYAYRPALTAIELVSGPKSTRDMIALALTGWTPADLARVFAPPTVLSEAEQMIFGEKTLQWIVWHTLEHEVHHGGELSPASGGYSCKQTMATSD